MTKLITPFVIFLLCLHSGIVFAKSLTVEDFKTESHLRDMAFSPDGRYLATLWSENRERTVIVQDMQDGGKQIAKSGSKFVRPNWITWASEERLLVNISIPVFKKEMEKDAKENPDFDFYSHPHVERLIAIDPDGGNDKKLLADKRQIRLNYSLSRIFHTLPEDKGHILVVARYGDRPSILRSNVKTGKSKLITKGSRNTVQFFSDAQGNPLYRLDWIDTSKTILIYDYVDGSWERKERFDYYEEDQTTDNLTNFAGVLEDGSIVFRKQNDVSGYHEILKRDRAGKTSVYVSYPDKDVLNLARGNGNSVIGHRVAEDNIIRTKYEDKQRQREYEKIEAQLVEIGVTSFNYSSWNKDSDLAIVRTNGQDDSGSFYFYQRGQNLVTFYSFAHRALNPDNLGVAAKVKYKARDGQQIQAYLLLPNDYQPGTKYPMVMLPHGGPHSRVYAYFNHFAQFLATRGYVVMQPNFRGSTGYGKAFKEAGHKQWDGVMREDIEDGVNYAIRAGLVDKSKVCIAGISFGGYAALIGSLNQDRLYRCAISMNGVSHIPIQVEYTAEKLEEVPWALKAVYESYGHPEKDKALLESHSPALRADEVSVPILLIGGKNDPIVPFKQQRIMRDALKEAGKKFQFIALDKTGHNPFRNRDNIEKVFTRIEEFLARHLK